jgi:NAD-dependent deacetylase
MERKENIQREEVFLVEETEGLARLVRTGGPLVVLSGAGMSTESNLADFRSREGLWARFDPMRLATLSALEREPGEFYAFYRMRLEALKGAEPNSGHRVLAKWEKKGILAAIVTQNVDGLHQRAGSKKVVELHGSLRTVRCLRCGAPFSGMELLERTECGKCGGPLRPEVVLFGENLPSEALEESERLASTCGFFLVLGSSLVVSPANSLPRIAKACGARLAIVNREPTPLDGIADLVVRGEIGMTLKAVDEGIEGVF